jgi:TRAP-type C4-dicarboxylate transport system permease small subunit
MNLHAVPDTLPSQRDGPTALDVPTTGVFGAVQRMLNAVNTLMAILSALAIGAAGCVLTWEVIGRYFLGIASDWQDELSTFLLVGATFASAAWTQARRGHVGIEALGEVLSPAANRIRRRIADIVAFAFCAFFAWKSWDLLVEAWVDDQTTPSAWGPPLWIPYSTMTIGMALLALQLALQALAGPQRSGSPH